MIKHTQNQLTESTKRVLNEDLGLPGWLKPATTTTPIYLGCWDGVCYYWTSDGMIFVFKDGTTVYPDGTMVLPDGTIIYPPDSPNYNPKLVDPLKDSIPPPMPTKLIST